MDSCATTTNRSATRVIEPETAKGASLFFYGVCSALAGMLGSTLPEPLSEYVQLGGGGAVIALLYLGYKEQKAGREEEKKERIKAQEDAKKEQASMQEKLDNMHDMRIEEKSKDLETRLAMAAALEKLSEKIGR